MWLHLANLRSSTYFLQFGDTFCVMLRTDSVISVDYALIVADHSASSCQAKLDR